MRRATADVAKRLTEAPDRERAAVTYRPRIADEQLRQMLCRHGAVIIKGARGIGKTTTAEQQAQSVLRLEYEADRERLRRDPDYVLRAAKPLLIDEWQYLPDAMNLVKNAVDRDKTAGQFILTESPYRVAGAGRSHSGIGRVLPLRMYPLAIAERAQAEPSVSVRDLLTPELSEIAGSTDLTKRDYAKMLLESGFPQCQDEFAGISSTFLDAYIDRLVEKDMLAVGEWRRQPSGTLIRSWLRAYAEASATQTRQAKLKQSAHVGDGDLPSRETANYYQETLEALGVIDEQPIWHDSTVKHLKSSSLHHLCDTGLAAYLMGHWTEESLMRTELDGSAAADQSAFGLLFQSFVTQSVRVYAGASDANVCWLGTTKQGGNATQREVDIIVAGPKTSMLAIEVKLANTVEDRDCAHLRWLRQRLGHRWGDGIVIYTGANAYRRDDGIGVVPAALLSP